MSKLPLSGITVVSLEQAVAAPFAARQLAEQGTRVIKIERPEVGDLAPSCDRVVLGAIRLFFADTDGSRAGSIHNSRIENVIHNYLN